MIATTQTCFPNEIQHGSKTSRMTEANSVSPDPETTSGDLHFISSGYRLVGDDKAFADCILAWTRKIAKVEAASATPSLDEDGLVKGYIEDIQDLLDKLIDPKEINPVDRAVSEVSAAAMVVTPRGIVVAANAAAKERFHATKGQLNRFAWLDPVSASDFDAVRDSAQAMTNHKNAVVRTCDERNANGLAEVYTLPAEDCGQHHLVIRALETHWAPAVDVILKDAFKMTAAEREVSRALYETRDTAQIAKTRNTTPQTIRTQIRTILRKTETSSQVDLIRLIGLLNARASHGQLREKAAWQDPWKNYRIIRRPDGKRLAFSWTGAKNGVPALIVHGTAQGYCLGEQVENRLKSAGICLYAVIRPGFADSESCPATDFLSQQADAIGWFIDTLDLQGVPAIGIGNGSASLYYLAAKRPGLLSRLLVTGLLKPYSEQSIDRFTPTQKVLIKLLRYAPKTSETLGRVCYRYVQQKGVDWYLDRGWNDVPEVRKTFENPEIMPYIRSGCELTLTTDVRGYLREALTQWDLNPKIVESVSCPIFHMHGKHDRSVTVEEAAELEKKLHNFTSEEVPDAGYFLPYEKPELFADRIVKTVLG